jgi:hypothetical protein
MSTRKSVQQLVRESVRRILSEAPAPAKPPAAKKPAAPAEPALKVKLFGTSDAPTSFRDFVTEKWSDVQSGYYKFTFTPAADKKTGTATVEAVNDPDQPGDLSGSVEEIKVELDKAVAALTPVEWGSIGAGYVYTYPGGVKYDSEINMDVQKENWARLAGLKRVL